MWKTNILILIDTSPNDYEKIKQIKKLKEYPCFFVFNSKSLMTPLRSGTLVQFGPKYRNFFTFNQRNITYITMIMQITLSITLIALEE